MIDLHNHILPEIDDGPQTWDDSAAMLEQAAAVGVSGIVASSHYHPEHWPRVADARKKLAEMAKKYNIVVYNGTEYDFSRLENEQNFITLGDSSYILIDFVTPYLSINNISMLCGELIRRKHRILVAHPERLFPADKLSILESLAGQGAFFQLNAGSFIGNFGRSTQKMADLLLKKGLCHCVASDAHNAGSTRGFCMDRCYEYLLEMHGEKTADYLVKINPQRIIDNLIPFPIGEEEEESTSFWNRLIKLFRKEK